MTADDRTAARQILATSLDQRARTATIARTILDLGGLPKSVRRQLSVLAPRNEPYGDYLDFMSKDFERPVPVGSQLDTLRVLFPGIAVPADCGLQITALRGLVSEGLSMLGVPAHMGAQEALEQRKSLAPTAGFATSYKALHKRLRFLVKLEDKISRTEAMIGLRKAQMQAKSRLAYAVDAEACDDLTLSFCAYLAARANRRSIFLVGPQSKAIDTIVTAMLDLLEDSETTAWDQVALVMPTPRVLAKLTPAQIGRVLGQFHAAMSENAIALSRLWHTLPERMRDEMVAVEGVDSSGWNAHAGSLNNMRSAWLNAMNAAGLEDALENYLPGKAPRLMASDLVWMYRSQGEELHEDTRMFSRLPHPWDVIGGVVPLGRGDIIAKAHTLGIDAKATGWVGPRAPGEIETPALEPALVHGVVVSDPALAASLKKAGAFSGKGLRDLSALPEGISYELVVSDDGETITPVVSPAPE